MPRSDDPLFSTLAGDPQMAELISLFVDELPDRVSAVTDAWHNGNVSELRRLAHQLKGAAGGYGFPVISESAAALESTLADDGHDLSGAQARLDEMVRLCRRAVGSSGSGRP